MIFLVVRLTPDNEHMCSETDFTQEKGNFHPTTRIPNSIGIMQEAGPDFDNHKKGMKNAFLIR